MRVRFTTSIAMNHATYAFGEVVDLPEQDAAAVVNAGHAERVDEPAPAAPAVVDLPEQDAAPVETAVASHPDEEQAVGKTARKKRS